MSHGLGEIQRIALRLIERNPHEAWDLVELAARIYTVDDVEKKYRVAVSRAVRRMPLPDGRRWYRDEVSVLYNILDDESCRVCGETPVVSLTAGL
jgi:hypothetical protein